MPRPLVLAGLLAALAVPGTPALADVRQPASHERASDDQMARPVPLPPIVPPAGRRLGPDAGSGALELRPSLARAGNGLVVGFGGKDEPGVLWAGTTRAHTLVIRNDGEHAVRDILVQLHGEGLSVDSVEADGLRWRMTEDGWLTALASLAPHQRVAATVAVTLRTDADPGPVENALVASLRVRDHEVTGTARSLYRVSDCAAAYHRDLQRLRAPFAAGLKETPARASSADPAMPGHWLFPPEGSVPQALRSAQRAADGAVRNRGADPFFRRDGVEWLLDKLHQEIERYLGQPPRPALCVTPEPMLASLQNKIDRIKQQADLVAGWHERAGPAADEALREALAAVEAARNELRGMPARAGARGQDRVAALLAALPADPAHAQAARHARDTLAALKAAQAALDEAMLAPAAARAVKAALSAIERAAYIAHLHGLHDGVHGEVTRALDAIRAASRRNCVCGH